jgi:hypothetical protein
MACTESLYQPMPTGKTLHPKGDMSADHFDGMPAPAETAPESENA